MDGWMDKQVVRVVEAESGRAGVIEPSMKRQKAESRLVVDFVRFYDDDDDGTGAAAFLRISNTYDPFLTLSTPIVRLRRRCSCATATTT